MGNYTVSLPVGQRLLGFAVSSNWGGAFATCDNVDGRSFKVTMFNGSTVAQLDADFQYMVQVAA